MLPNLIANVDLSKRFSWLRYKFIFQAKISWSNFQILRLNVFLDKKRNKKLPCPGGLFRFNFIMLVDGANDDPAPDWLHMNGHRSFSQFGPRKSNRESEREWERNKVIKTKWTSNWSLLDINQSWATHNGQAETIAKIILANVAVTMVGLAFTDSKKLLPRL